MKSVTEFSPAKINLFLAVTGRRSDGYHELVSVVALLDFGDELAAEGARSAEGGARGENDAERGERRADMGPETQATPGGEQESDMGRETQATAGGGGQGADVNRGTRTTALECDDPAVPVDGSNLVLKAARAFWQAQAGAFRQAQARDEAESGQARAGNTAGDEVARVPAGGDFFVCPPGDTREHGGTTVRFRLKKRIPIGAGLGGGSSNGVAALRALNALEANPLAEPELERIAAGLGSDCVLFLRGAPAIMRGRGERVEVLPEGAARRLRGRRVLLFKPSFGIATAWAYRRLAERATDYVPAAEAEARLAAWVNAPRPAEDLLFNNLEPVAFEKYPALPLLLAALRREFGVAAGMSGSGSACFALLSDAAGGGAPDEIVTRMTQRIRACWGPAAWVQAARVM